MKYMKKYYAGLDIGSVSVKLVILDAEKKILKDYYVRIEGEALRRTAKVLRDAFALFRQEDIAGMAVTGSGGKLVSEILGVPFINEIISQSKSTGFLYPGVKTIIEIGGEDSKFILLDAGRGTGAGLIRDFSMNTICAAGTGSFLDQQASRMGYTIEEFSEISLKSVTPPRIAGRCSVFAKTDMIHLQQEATPDYDIIAGLCHALARNFRSTIAKNKDFEKPISFQGGVAANKGMARAFSEVLGLAGNELVIPEYFVSMGAIGAALALIENPLSQAGFRDISELEKYRMDPAGARLDRLTVSAGVNIFDSLDEKPIAEGGITDVFLGVDVGSVSTNVVAIDGNKRLLSRQYLPTAGRPIEAVRKGIDETGKEIGGRVRVRGAGTTGSGRYMTGDLIGADVVKNEITAQARASIEIDKSVDTVFEIGGQDSKFISLKNGVVTDFEMNKVCAAGTGSFLEEQAERLGISIKGEFGDCALRSQAPLRLGERCTVFMETDVVNHQQRGAGKEDIASGLSYSIVQNYLNRVVGDKKIGGNIFFQGAVAFNRGVVSAFEKVTGKKITVPPNNDVTGAIGVALIAMEYMKKNGLKESRFKGFDLSKKKYSISAFECKGCANRCEVKKVEVEGDSPLYYGSRCEKYEVGRKKAKVELPDLFAEREELLMKPLKDALKSATATKKARFSIGIPRVLYFYELMPLWITLFRELGFDVVLSDATNKSIIHNGVESVVSEHCFPIKVAHGHIQNLLEKKCSHIFFPVLVNLYGEYHGIEKSYECPFVQACPDIIKSALELGKETELLSPVVYLRRGKEHLVDVMFRMLDRFGIKKAEVRKAAGKAVKAQTEFYGAVRKRGSEILGSLKERAVVVVGRPYNTCDPGLNLEIPKKLREMGILAIPMDYLTLEKVELGVEWPNMYWKYGQQILAALRIIKAHPKLYPLYITNFGCGPDSFILKYFGKEAGRKPYLSIEVDEHSAGAGVITRCEAFLDSLENLGDIIEPHLPGQSIISYSPSQDDLAGRRLYVPYMGNSAYIVAAAFRACGLDSEVMQVADSRSVELGRRHTSGKECFPCIITTGDIVKMLQSPGFDRRKAAFFMPSASGPCRFGQYSKWQRLVLDDLGFPDIPVLAPNQSSDFYKSLSGYGRDFDRRAWLGVCAVDAIDKLVRETRPYEKNRGESDRLYGECLKMLEKAIEDGSIFDYRRMLESIRGRFETVKAGRRSPARPVIGIVGEIYIRSHHFANNGIVNAVEELGGETRVSSMAEWFFYTNKNRLDGWALEKNYIRYLIDSVKDAWQRQKEHITEEVFCGLLSDGREPGVEEMLNSSNPYLNRSIEGEAVLSVGKAIDYIRKGASGIINVMPFTCMPGTNVSAVLTRVKKDFGDIPVLNMSYDGLEQTTARTRLEAFMFQAAQFKNSVQRPVSSGQ
ncbi:CoA activase [Candidatus Desantisbacteria bacterium CG_4_10_14_0_8_um_filter_48_22]|uniref:CoA activase n=1 Tax=Candidatus Desantisbacteria bacterium CG_4_10_14_0_8_um_filter_48_22 TaxID=1974543 RepID=A0A2M7S4X7_9BACT|nr:MAG: CoA activase [Candidatus Desantisbacteria bacterium CG02_land_8_20_14_3_00_49_13]PIZ14584.1 MAG: CoA activase [Candidatus Desantisbacteria bacterium CG_4_10_14_0_8_um_filter_48_22]